MDAPVEGLAFAAPTVEPTSVGEELPEAGLAGADGALPAAPIPVHGQWPGLSMKVQPDLRPAQVYESRISRIELDAESTSLIAEISVAAAQLDALPVAAVPVAADAPLAQPVIGGFDDNHDIDADIREVFLEEFDEERANLARMVPHWQQAPEEMERLRPIRRVFHTLKGSGRLVGARELGEFSWKIEGMLNRVLDGTRPASPAVVAMVQQACEVLPQFDVALRGQGSVSADLAAIEKVADRVAIGEDAFYAPQAGAAPAAVPLVEADTVVPSVADLAGAVPAVDGDMEEGTPASVDSVLREILEAEVTQHLETVDGWIAAARSAPEPATDALLRAIHTMNGAFAMTDVPEITGVTDPAETFVKRSLAASLVPEAVAVDALAAMADAIRTCIRALQTESPRIPRFTELSARLHALAGSLPEARWPQAMEAEAEVAAPIAIDAGELAGVDLSAYLGMAEEDVPLDAAALGIRQRRQHAGRGRAGRCVDRSGYRSGLGAGPWLPANLHTRSARTMRPEPKSSGSTISAASPAMPGSPRRKAATSTPSVWSWSSSKASTPVWSRWRWPVTNRTDSKWPKQPKSR